MAKAKPSGSGGNRPIPEEKSYKARCVGVIELGTQKEFFQGKPKENFKIMFQWELLGTKVVFSEEKGEQPFLVSEKYTLSLSDKASLYKLIMQWRGKKFTEEELKEGYDCQNLLGKPCMVTIIHNTGKGENSGKVFANIGSVTKAPEDLKEVFAKLKTTYNEQVGFVIGEANQFEQFEKLPEWIRKKIEDSPEWKAECKKHKYSGVAETSKEEEEENGIHRGDIDGEDDF